MSADSPLEKSKRRGIFSKDDLVSEPTFVDDAAEFRKQNVLVGQIAVRRGLVKSEQLAECLQEQTKTGEPLGEILLARGYLTPAQLGEILAEQKSVSGGKTTLLCRKCGSAFVVAKDEFGAYRCPRCFAILIRRSPVTQSTAVEIPLEHAEIPPDVRVALNQNNQVIGKYVVLKKIGEGGCSTVYRAFDLELERIVALKVFMLASGVDFQRTRMEAQVVARLSHPGIPKIFETGTDENSHYMAMEYVDGRSAGQIPLETKEVLRTGMEVARILEYAHAQGVIHRDVKPQNIIIDSSGKVWLTDFGIAKTAANEGMSLTKTGTIIGTPQFMSPEQATGMHREIDARTDIFSLGSTMYFLLTGITPFDGANMLQIADAIIRRDPQTIRTISPMVQPEECAIVEKAMEKSRDRRYQTAKEMADDIERFLKGEPISARPLGSFTRLVRKIERRKSAALATAALVLVVTFGAYWGISEYSRRKTEEVKHEKLETQSKALIEAILTDISNAHRDALRRRKGGEKFRALSAIPVQLKNSAMFKHVESEAMKDARVRFSFGRLYRIVGDDAAAMREQLAAISLKPDFGQALYEAGILYYRQYQKVMNALRDEWRRRKTGEPVDENIETKEATLLRDKELRCFESAIANLPSESLELATARSMFRFLNKDMSARTDFAQVLNTDRSQEDAAGFLADIYVKEGNLDAAIKVLSDALNEDKGNTAFLLFRARLYRWLGINSKQNAAKYYDSSIADLSTAITLNDEEDNSYVDRGNVYNDYALHSGDEKHFTASIADLDRAIALNASNYLAWLCRGVTHLNLGLKRESAGVSPDELYNNCLRDFSRAIELNPNSDEAWLKRAQLHVNWAARKTDIQGNPTGDFEEGLNDASKALELNRNSYEGRVTRGSLRMNIAGYKMNKRVDPCDDYRKAVEDYAKAGDLNPAAVEPKKMQAQALSEIAGFKMRMNDEPLEELQAAIIIYGKLIVMEKHSFDYFYARASLWANLAQLHQRRGEKFLEELQSAESDFTESIKLNAGRALSFRFRGNVRATLGSCFELAKDYPRAAALYDSAVADWEQAFKLDPAATDELNPLINAARNKSGELKARLNGRDY